MKTVTFNEAILTKALDTMFGEQARVAVVRFYDMLEGVRTEGYVEGLSDGWKDANEVWNVWNETHPLDDQEQPAEPAQGWQFVDYRDPFLEPYEGDSGDETTSDRAHDFHNYGLTAAELQSS
jgi:hypothetical protein